jgi:arabinogalactan endo-1,4-beta-galactosidase
MIAVHTGRLCSITTWCCVFFLALAFYSCGSSDDEDSIDVEQKQVIKAIDLSSFPKIDQSQVVYYSESGAATELTTIARNKGVNTIRLKLWVHPSTPHSGFDEVRVFSQALKDEGFKIWLTLHYSDTWADPGQQAAPAAWSNQSISELRTTVYDYTSNVVNTIKPDYIQIGNEVNSGMLHPLGDINRGPNDFLSLLRAGISAVRDHSTNTKIIIHYAGIDGATWFYDQVKTIDYDIIGLSYYPIWHGKSLTGLEQTMIELASTHSKEVVIAETAYPFTLGYADYTNNIVGLEEQLILPQYLPTPMGQMQFLKSLKTISTSFEKGIGFCYWGGELIAWKGDQATDASPWENQALFNFDHQAVLAWAVFSEAD